jgi:L-threonylcarbamoyladenylate synthase
MHTEILPASSSNTISHAYEILQKGGLVAFPTDTVYGVNAGVRRESRRVHLCGKDRPAEKAIRFRSATRRSETVGVHVRMSLKLAIRFWPGPLTILVPKRADLPAAVSATATVGVRVPDHEVARALLRATGPMAVTSANISGAQSPVTAQEVYEQLGGRIALIIDGGRTPGGVPSTLVDCTLPALKILREGPISWDELRSALRI